MYDILIEFIISQGIFALLFVILFIYTIKSTQNREEKFYSLLEKFIFQNLNNENS
ncbi:MAG: BhlA/UviB family holin-like peptide [Sarcina sp.]